MNTVERDEKKKKKHAHISAIHSVSMPTPKTLKPMRDVILEEAVVHRRIRNETREKKGGGGAEQPWEYVTAENNNHWIGIRCAGLRV